MCQHFVLIIPALHLECIYALTLQYYGIQYFRWRRQRKIVVGGARRDRTVDLLRARQALSQLSYGPKSSSYIGQSLVGLGGFNGQTFCTDLPSPDVIVPITLLGGSGWI